MPEECNAGGCHGGRLRGDDHCHGAEPDAPSLAHKPQDTWYGPRESGRPGRFLMREPLSGYPEEGKSSPRRFPGRILKWFLGGLLLAAPDAMAAEPMLVE